MDRDPRNPAAVAAAVAAWLAAQRGAAASQAAWKLAEEADAALVGVLLDEGVLSPADLDFLSFEYGSVEHGLVDLFLFEEDLVAGTSVLRVHPDGRTEMHTFDNPPLTRRLDMATPLAFRLHHTYGPALPLPLGLVWSEVAYMAFADDGFGNMLNIDIPTALHHIANPYEVRPVQLPDIIEI